MMKQIEEIKNALESVDVSTARGRRTLNGRQIDIEPDEYIALNSAEARGHGYLKLSNDMRNMIHSNRAGIPEAELERVELVMEQLETLALMAMEMYVKTY